MIASTKKTKQIALLVVLVLIAVAAFVVIRKLNVKKHFIIVSIENLYVENPTTKDPLFSKMDSFAQAHNLKIWFVPQPPELKINWISAISQWPETLWQNHVKPLGEHKFSTTIFSDRAQMASAVESVKKALSENADKTFFTLLNYQTLTSPLLEKAFSEMQTSGKITQDAAELRNALNEKKLLVASSLETLLNEMNAKGELEQTEIVIVNNTGIADALKTSAINKVYTDTLQMQTGAMVVSSQDKNPWERITDPNSFNTELMKKMQEFSQKSSRENLSHK